MEEIKEIMLSIESLIPASNTRYVVTFHFRTVLNLFEAKNYPRFVLLLSFARGIPLCIEIMPTFARSINYKLNIYIVSSGLFLFDEHSRWNCPVMCCRYKVMRVQNSRRETAI